MTEAARTVRLDYTAFMDEEGLLDPVGHDLLALSRAAFLVDRDAPRGSSPDGSRWHRELVLNVAVQQPERWGAPEVSEAVVRLLDWVTDDSWNVSWTRLKQQTNRAGQARFPLLDRGREVMLFSGGLDAVAGAAHLLSQHEMTAVAAFTNRVMQHYQTRTIRELHRAKLGSLEFHQIDFSVQQGKRDSEPTRRSRGLVFLSLGAAMALRSHRNSFVIAENGIGALNLPFTKAQSGAMTSRSAHPLTLRLFANVVQLVTQQPFTVVAPFLTTTKAEMIRLLPEAARPACASSESCDLAAAGRGTLQRRCGFCTSCLLRRMSFGAAGRVDWDPRPYAADSSDADTEKSREPEMLWQAATLDRALRDPAPGRLLEEFPELRHVPPDVLDESCQRRLLGAYVDEWRINPSPAVRRFLDPTPLAG